MAGFHHSRSFIYRPFLSLSSPTLNCDQHISNCLSAARTTIQTLHSAFTHRHYIRSWWYNATHTLFASTILLHVLLLDKPDILSTTGCDKESLIEDVHKSLQILRAMDQMPVAVRYAGLLGDILAAVEQSPYKHQNSHEGGILTQDLSSNDVIGSYLEFQEAGTANFGGNGSQSQQETTAARPAQHSVPLRDYALASLIDNSLINNFETASDDLMFGTSDGWNVAGNVFSDFTFTGENTNVALWDWEHN
jgi:hypothetical protein